MEYPTEEEHAATDVGMPASSSSVSSDYQGSAGKRKAQGSWPAAYSGYWKRHRVPVDDSQPSPSTLVEDAYSDYIRNTIGSLEGPNEAQNNDTHLELEAMLAQLDYPEDATTLPPEIYDEIMMEAQRLLMQGSATPPRPLSRTTSEVETQESSQGTSRSNSTTVLSDSPWKCPVATTSCRQYHFTRITDRDRHILFTHLSISVMCTNRAHDSTSLSRPDGVPRHMKNGCCLGLARYDTLKRKHAERLGLRPTDRGVLRAVHQEYVRIVMPCYQRKDVKEMLAMLRHPRRLDQLEECFSWYGKVERCTCGPCRRRLQPGPTEIPIPTAATRREGMKPGTNAEAGMKKARRLEVAVEDEDEDERLPPEEEEGVDDTAAPGHRDPALMSSLTVHEDSAPIATHTAEMDDEWLYASDTDAASQDIDVTDTGAIPMEDTPPITSRWRRPGTGQRLSFGIFARAR